MSLLEVKNLKKSFGKAQILRGVSFSLEVGEVLSIIGSSGGGKTTLLRCLNFLETPDEGEISLDGNKVFYVENGQPVVVSEAQSGMGLVFQQFNLFPQYNVLENVMLAPKLAAKKDPNFRKNKKAIFEQIETRAKNILASVGLSEKELFYPCQLSGGQQQRVAIARALMLQPKILCFDEPTSALDPELTGEVLRVIKSLKSSDITMIIVTHEMEFAKSVSDKIIFVADGLIEEEGTPDEVFNNTTSERAKAFLNKEKNYF